MFQTKRVEKINTHTSNSATFFQKVAVCKIMWKSTVQPDGSQMTIWRMRIACWIPKVTGAHSEYVLLIAFPLQKWL
jgi:hypothetical protein